MWHDLLLAFALVLILEGLLPGIYPAGWRRMIEEVSRMDDRTLRLAGVGSMIAGAVLFNLVR